MTKHYREKHAKLEAKDGLANKPWTGFRALNISRYLRDVTDIAMAQERQGEMLNSHGERSGARVR